MKITFKFGLIFIHTIFKFAEWVKRLLLSLQFCLVYYILKNSARSNFFYRSPYSVRPRSTKSEFDFNSTVNPNMDDICTQCCVFIFLLTISKSKRIYYTFALWPKEICNFCCFVFYCFSSESYQNFCKNVHTFIKQPVSYCTD